LRVVALGSAGLLAGFLAIAFLLAALSERRDVCACADGSRRSGWAWGLSSPERSCERLCDGRGGGAVVPTPPELLRRTLTRGAGGTRP
jgi:hypothetical protein